MIAWLDEVASLDDGTGWQSHAISAITEQQQFTGFDCGVACLLYAEKAAQQQAWQDIRAFTDQAEITRFRETLHDYFRAVGLASATSPQADPRPGPGRSGGTSAGRSGGSRTGSKGRKSRGRGRGKGRAKKEPQPEAATVTVPPPASAPAVTPPRAPLPGPVAPPSAPGEAASAAPEA